MGCIPAKQKSPEKLTDQERMIRKLSVDTRAILTELNEIPEHFCFKKVLGHGRYGRILLWESTESRYQFAIKAVSKKNVPSFQLTEEVKTLSKVDHPNIVKYFSSFQSEKYLYVVMEYCPGGNLFDRVVQQEKFNEAEAKVLMEKIFRAINHCHHLGIIHRDLKPENIMHSSEGILKIIDFGLSMHANTFSLLRTAGTTFYIAPEVLEEGIFTSACDIWSLGITLHILLSGFVPIVGKTVEEINANIKAYTGPNFSGEAWSKVSLEAKDLVRRMLVPNHKVRITAADALNHPWFTSKLDTDMECNPELLESLRKYGEFSDLKKKILNLLVKGGIDSEDLKNIQKNFLDLDKGKTGLITCKDLHDYLQKSGYKITADELERITKKANYKGEAFINYSEFIAAIISTQQFLTEEKLWTFFKMMDVRKEGTIDQKALQSAFPEKEIIHKIQLKKPGQVETNSSEKITFEDFKNILWS